jgi:RNA polymerase sigma factor (sigma-70 family)
MLYEKFKPLVLSYAKYLSGRYKVDINDLIQEGTLALLELEDRVDQNSIPRMVKFVKLNVVGAMKNYVAANCGPVSVQKDKFWTEGWATFYAPLFDMPNTTNPEELLIQKEGEATLDEFITDFLRQRNINEKLIFYACVYAENPTSIREVAERTGLAKSTVGRIKKDLEERWKEYLNANER